MPEANTGRRSLLWFCKIRMHLGRSQSIAGCDRSVVQFQACSKLKHNDCCQRYLLSKVTVDVSAAFVWAQQPVSPATRALLIGLAAVPVAALRTHSRSGRHQMTCVTAYCKAGAGRCRRVGAQLCNRRCCRACKASKSMGAGPYCRHVLRCALVTAYRHLLCAPGTRSASFPQTGCARCAGGRLAQASVVLAALERGRQSVAVTAGGHTTGGRQARCPAKRTALRCL